ncbi:MAG TPA: hypothetical protein VFQ36_20505 [Ktedonobacteraceae bacterium]|nr:hypothetical protein [Ktedonobacteraceae bacterium]
MADSKGKIAGEAVVSNAANTRLTGPWRIVARAVWLALVVPSLGLFIASLLISNQQLQSGAIPTQSLSTIGLSVSGFVILNTIFNVITSAIWYGVGFFIFWRRSDDWLALLAAFVLVMFNVTSFSNNNTPSVLVLAYPTFALPLSLMNFLGIISLGVFFLLFPGGRLVPRWMGLILLLFIISEFLGDFPSPSSAFDANWPAWLQLLMTLVIYGAIIYSQIYRYRRVSTPAQRQQTKWVILGVAVAIGVITGILAFIFLLPSNLNSNAYGTFIVTFIIWPAALLLIPLSIGFSILRYRLYDIDLLINRTLVYGTLTVLLALVYAGLVIGLQAFVRLFTGQASQSPVVIVASTLAIAALFQPLRHRLQAIIDHRFYRRKYDAARTVAAFSTTLRNEVDLAQLSEHLMAVVEETMQPSHVSLWLRSAGHKRTEHNR